MPIAFGGKLLTSLEDIQKLKVTELRQVLKCYSQSCGGAKADLILQVFALVMQSAMPNNNANNNQNMDSIPKTTRDYYYQKAIQESGAVIWSADLRKLPKMNFVQLYDYLVGKTRKYKHVVLKNTNYKKLKSYQFFFEGLGLGLFAIEDFSRKELQLHQEPLACTSRLSVWVVPRNQSVSAKPADEILIRKIQFGKNNIRQAPKTMSKYDPRAIDQRVLDQNSFDNLCSDMKKSLKSSSFFLFHDLVPPSNTNRMTSSETSESDLPFNDFYDISSQLFEEMVDIHVKHLTITEVEVVKLEQATRGQAANEKWMSERKKYLTSSNFGAASKLKVGPSKKLRPMLYSEVTTEGMIYGLQNKGKAVSQYLSISKEKGLDLEAREVGLKISIDKPYLGSNKHKKSGALKLNVLLVKLEKLQNKLQKTKTSF